MAYGLNNARLGAKLSPKARKKAAQKLIAAGKAKGRQHRTTRGLSPSGPKS